MPTPTASEQQAAIEAMELSLEQRKERDKQSYKDTAALIALMKKNLANIKVMDQLNQRLSDLNNG